MATQNASFSNKLETLIDQLGRTAEGAAADKDLSAGMLKDLRSMARDLYSAAAKEVRQLCKARVIDSDEVVRLWDEWKRKGNNKAVGADREKKNQGTTCQYNKYPDPHKPLTTLKP